MLIDNKMKGTIMLNLDLDIKMKNLISNLEKLAKGLENLNSHFSATQEFLQARGKTHIKECNKEEKEELFLFIENKLKQINAKFH